ncbi:MAG TPA: PaaI family thioesterase [Burkholderiales bacterium]|nr:PaaI family thioesterase [Burkholderiales bacterium]
MSGRKKTIDEEAARAAFERALKAYDQDFETFFLIRLFGMEFDYREDSCRISFELKDYMFNPQGGLHGGVIAFVLDISMGHLLYKTSGPGTTLEIKVQYVKAARSGKVTATGRFLRHGRSISYLRSELVDEKGELIAYATSTWKSLRRE